MSHPSATAPQNTATSAAIATRTHIDDLKAWIEHTLDGELIARTRVAGGNRRQSWSLEIRHSHTGAVVPAFLRFDPHPVSEAEDPYSLWRESKICAHAHAGGIPVPKVLGVHPTAQAVLVELVEGTSDFRAATVSAQNSIAREFMHHLAELHRLPVRPGDLPDPLPPEATTHDAVTLELARWREIYRLTGVPDPLVEFGLQWLEQNIPAISAPPVLVHGDTGPGNFLFVDDRLCAIIDWELAHLGDPMEDLAWLSLRAAQEGWPDFDTRVREYEDGVGAKVSVSRIRYHRVFAELRIVIIRLRDELAVGERSSGAAGEVGNSILSGALHRRLCVEALFEAAGRECPDASPLIGEDDGSSWIAASALRQLSEELLPSAANNHLSSRIKGVARAIKVLDAERRLGPAAHDREISDLTELLGARPADLRAGRRDLVARIRAGSVTGDAVLDYLSRRVAAETQIRNGALGALANRHHPPLLHFNGG